MAVPKATAAANKTPQPIATAAPIFLTSSISEDWRAQLPCNLAKPTCKSKWAAWSAFTVPWYALLTVLATTRAPAFALVAIVEALTANV